MINLNQLNMVFCVILLADSGTISELKHSIAASDELLISLDESKWQQIIIQNLKVI